MESFNIVNYLNFWAEKVEKWIRDNITHTSKYSLGLIESMRYSLLAGGKRIRPAIIFSSYGIFDNYFDKVIPFAAAVEILHTYSLIHDDLPAMDNDDYRRGKPTNHKMFNEATAILAGDALLTKAFEIMSNSDFHEDISCEMANEAIYKLAVAAGEKGMVGGQFADIRAEKQEPNAEMVNFIHLNKTAALIAYSAELGAILGFASDKDKENLKKFGLCIGQAFQIADDLIDISSTTEEIGKDAGSDLEKGKVTYPAVFGVKESEEMAEKLIDDALSIVKQYGKAAKPLEELAKFTIQRKK
jgi:geranylgeranyl diphosphate synthase type II